jgi:MerR family transcriptional regulator/heat shock protein HspR
MYHMRHTEGKCFRHFPGENAESCAMTGTPSPDADRGVYGITTAAELVGMGVQNLRLYEARGLLEPDRTDGGTRRYSAEDLDRLRRIGDLLEAGLNLAGIGMVLGLENENAQLRAEHEEQGWLPTARLRQKGPAPKAAGGPPASRRSR